MELKKRIENEVKEEYLNIAERVALDYAFDLDGAGVHAVTNIFYTFDIDNDKFRRRYSCPDATDEDITDIMLYALYLMLDNYF